MKIFSIVFFLFFSFSFTNAQSALNVELFGQIQRSDARYSGSWSYIAPDGSEYALLGAATGTAAYSIDDPNDIVELGFVPGPTSNWREITVIGQHAYVTTEGSGPGTGMQVIALAGLPDSLSLLTTYDETFTRGHILQRDIYTDAPYVYVNGTTSTEGVHIIDVSDPANPVEVGLYDPGYYIHDCHVNGDLLFAAAFFEAKMDIIDISDKTNPTFINDFSDPNGKTHSSWLTEDKTHLFMASEEDGTYGRIFNVEDLFDPYAVATYSANLASLVHNPYIRGDYAFISHNTEGLRVVDIADPAVPVEVGYYDTFAGPSGGFSGLWSACPYFPSGKIIGGNRTDGLYIWTFNNAKASRVYGLVVDELTGNPIPSAGVLVEENQDSLVTALDGTFKTGALFNTYTFISHAMGYETDTLVVEVMPGEQETITIELTPTIINSTTESAAESDLRVWPNPCSTPCTLQFSDYPKDRIITVYDLDGKALSNHRLSPGQNWDWDTALRGTGLFFISIKTENGALLGRHKILMVD